MSSLASERPMLMTIFVHPGHHHPVGVSEALHQPGIDLLLVLLLDTLVILSRLHCRCPRRAACPPHPATPPNAARSSRHTACTRASSSCPRGSSSASCTPLLHFVQTSMTFETFIGASFSMMPPWSPWVRGFVCRWMKFDSLDHHTLRLRHHLEHLPALAAVVPGNYFHDVVLRDLHLLFLDRRGTVARRHLVRALECRSYRTSGARATIFMNFFSLSSLATGPKIRVPIGSFCGLTKTAALSSKRMYDPSFRLISLLRPARSRPARPASS